MYELETRERGHKAMGGSLTQYSDDLSDAAYAALEVQTSASKDAVAAVSAAASVAKAKLIVTNMPEGLEKEAAKVAVAQQEAQAAVLEMQASAAKDAAVVAVSAAASKKSPAPPRTMLSRSSR